MKTRSVVVSTVMIVLTAVFFLGNVHAGEKATKEECVAKVEAAAKLVKEIGLEPALKKIMEPDGPYKWKDSYVFCMNVDMGKLMAHPVTRFIGFPMKNWKDADGAQPFAKVIDEIDTQTKGWVKYNFRAPGAAEPGIKTTYYLKIPGENAILGAGYMQ